ncbi:MAG: hypothetical protein LJE75_13150 [Gammaproteobacteria bacterium]|jgi:hypothetical protein|nr:hypothetical protein [Gammaproteobacteria bacterium]
MKQPLVTTLLSSLLLALSATAYTPSASANAAGECRQEAVDYGISEELVDEYVSGCLASRGELMIDDVSDTEYASPSGPEDEQVLLEEPPMGDEDAAQ